jgi:DNA-binding PadR family transcriptional regulator
MPDPPHGADPMRGGIVGMFALSLMDREGPVHGYRVAESIAEKTEGNWRPGPGAIYPTLRRLVDRKYARARKEGARTFYEITPPGKALLTKVRNRQSWRRRFRPDHMLLMADVLGMEDVGEFLQLRLQRDLLALERHLEQGSTPEPVRKALAAKMILDLRKAMDQLDAVVDGIAMPARTR